MTIYTQTARFDSARALTEDEMHKLAPSIFATEAHESRSDRFAPIATINVIKALMGEGFMPVGVQQSGSRDMSKREFTKHLIRLRKIEDDAKYNVGDTVCEILLKNANDGTCQYELLAGLFRMVCKNSLVSQTGTIDSLKVRHSGDAIPKVIEGTYRVLGEAHKALEAPANWSQMQLAPEERQAFAEQAHAIRFEGNETLAREAIDAGRLLRPRRHADTGTDLWSTFNVAQENVIRGGLHGRARDANNRLRNVSTREVKGIDQTLKLNQALWAFTQRVAELKGAGA
jgi:hypothetical protein